MGPSEHETTTRYYSPDDMLAWIRRDHFAVEPLNLGNVYLHARGASRAYGREGRTGWHWDLP